MLVEQISYKRHRLPARIIAHVVWLYVRFNLSLRAVDELMLERAWTFRMKRFGVVPKRSVTDKL